MPLSNPKGFVCAAFIMSGCMYPHLCEQKGHCINKPAPIKLIYLVKVDPTDAMVWIPLMAAMTKQEQEDNVIMVGATEALLAYETEQDAKAAVQIIREQTGRLICYMVAQAE
jgi:hypothetical protein